MNAKRFLISAFSILIAIIMLAACGSNDDKKGPTDLPDDVITGDEDVPAPDDGTKVNITYMSENTAMGYISGNKTQQITYGKTTTSKVEAVAEVGYEFVSWSDGVTEAVRDGESPKRSGTLTAKFQVKPLDLPIIMLTTNDGNDITSKDYYVDGKISVLNVDEQYLLTDLDMQIRGRGNYTWDSTFNTRDTMYNKRPYKIKLSEQQKLCGVGEGKSKKWALLADHCDQSLLRNNIVYTFAKSLSGIFWQPSVQSVEVYLNGEYIGVYLLAEQVQVNSNKINVSEDLSERQIGFLAMYSNYATGWGYEYFYVDGHPYEIKNDLSENESLAYEQSEYVQECIYECWSAVMSGNEQKVRELIDIDSVIDTYIVHEVFKNLDTGHDNFFMFKDKEGDKLHFGPVWDFDQCAGNANEDVDNYENIRGGNTQPWYSNLLKRAWFRKALVARWNELKPEIDKIPQMIKDAAQRGYNSYCRNFDRWQIFGYKINRETVVRKFTTYDEHFEYFAEFMVNRIAWYDGYLNGGYAEGEDYTFEGDGSYYSPYLIKSEKDFLNFTKSLLSGEEYDYIYFRQEADIDMSSVDGYSGVGSRATFAGIYDGNGHKINIDINGTDGCIFPYLNGVVYNLVATGKINNSSYSGGIARSVRSYGSIINCISLVDVTSTGANAGGIAASNQDGAMIINCYFGGSVEASGEAAPICVWYSGRNGYFINNYYNEGVRHDVYDNQNVEKEETALNAEELLTLADRMNALLDSDEYAYLAYSYHVCRWQMNGSTPEIITRDPSLDEDPWQSPPIIIDDPWIIIDDPIFIGDPR